MAKKRVLITYATAGTGHKKAAFAVKKAFDELGRDDIEVDIIDSLDYTSAFFKWTYPRIYIFLINRIPLVWGLAYYLLDNRAFYGLVSWIRHFTNWINSRPLARYLHRENYDLIISTHFLVPDVISMEGKKKIGAFLVNVITDYRLHSFWIAKGVDIYTGAHEKTREDLISRYGIHEDRIKVLGVPIDPVFSKTKGRDMLMTGLGIKKDLFTVLIGSGGFGVGPIVDLVKSFKGISIPMQLLVVCGTNDALRVSIDALDVGMPVKSFGFIENMDELMEVSDAIVTKTGGMMSSEALSKDLPIVAIASIPGQETRNFNILLQSGVALKAGAVNDVPGIIAKLYKDKALAGELKEKIKHVKKPAAAQDIAKAALEALGK